MNKKIGVITCMLFCILFCFEYAWPQQTVGVRNRYKVAQNLFNSARYEEAEKELTEALKQDGRYSDARFLLALTQLQLKKYDDSAKNFEQVIRQEPKFFTARLYLANVFLQKKEFDAAREQVQIFISNTPADPNGHYAMGVICYVQNQLDRAVDAWKKTLSLDKKNAPAYYNMGIALYLMGEKQEGLDNVNKALELRSNNSNLYRFTSACMKYNMDMKREALEDFTYIRDLIATTPMGLVSSAYILKEEGKTSEALESLNKAIQMDDAFQKAYELKAVICEEQESFDDAIKAYERVLLLDSNEKWVEEKLTFLRSAIQDKLRRDDTGPEKSKDRLESVEHTGTENSGKQKDERQQETLRKIGEESDNGEKEPNVKE